MLVCGCDTDTSRGVTGIRPLFSKIRTHLLVQFCLSQVAGLIIAILIGKAVSGAEIPVTMPANVFLSGIAGVGASATGMVVFRLPWWWGFINLMFPLTISITLAADMPAWWFAVCFLALAVVYRNAGSTRIPLYLSNRATATAVAGLLPRGDSPQAVDLGSGIGGIVGDMARCRPDCHFTGIENAPLPFAFSLVRHWFWCLPNLTFRYGNLWSTRLDAYDLVYCFLSPVPMTRLYQKARTEMRPGTTFVSNSFHVPEIPPDKVIKLGDKRRTRLFIWHM